MKSLPIAVTSIAFVVVAGSISGPLRVQETSAGESEPLKVGDVAPDFEIPSTVPVPPGGTTVSVSAITEQDQAVVIAFFPKAFTGG